MAEMGGWQRGCPSCQKNLEITEFIDGRATQPQLTALGHAAADTADYWGWVPSMMRGSAGQGWHGRAHYWRVLAGTAVRSLHLSL